jgi:hypothetical protein
MYVTKLENPQHIALLSIAQGDYKFLFYTTWVNIENKTTKTTAGQGIRMKKIETITSKKSMCSSTLSIST